MVTPRIQRTLMNYGWPFPLLENKFSHQLKTQHHLLIGQNLCKVLDCRCEMVDIFTWTQQGYQKLINIKGWKVKDLKSNFEQKWYFNFPRYLIPPPPLPHTTLDIFVRKVESSVCELALSGEQSLYADPLHNFRQTFHHKYCMNRSGSHHKGCTI